MKKMMMALAALCVAGAASAVATDWKNWTEVTVDGGNSTNKFEGYDRGIEGLGANYAVKVTFQYNASMIQNSSSGKYGTFLVFGVESDEREEVASLAVKNDNGRLQLALGGVPFGGQNAVDNQTVASNATWKDVNFVSGTGAETATNTLIVEVNGTAVSVYLNGTEVLTGTATSSLAGADLIQWGKYPMNKDRLDVVLKTDSTSGGLTGSVAYAVPEPTALALLALGVAGLALRRRAA